MSIVASQLIAEVKIVGDTEAKQKLGKVSESVDKTAGGFKSMLGNALSFAGGLGVFDLASTALGYLKDQFSGVFQESMDAQAGMAQTVSVLKSTHDASGMTADAIADLAGNLSHLTTFSDDTVQAGENMLLTFTNIGKNVFPQATKTVLDMSQALGQDTKNSAIQLGKALNDPITGITALQRVGVTFDDSQKKLIKTYMAHNEIAKAQAVILKELQREFGGSAEAAGKTFGGQMTILNQRISDVKQSIGDALLPVVTKLTSFVSGQVMPVLSAFADWFTKSGFPAIEKFVSGVFDSVTQSTAFHTILTDLVNDLSLVGNTALALAGDAETFVSGIADAAAQSGAFQSVLQLIQDILPDVANFLTQAGSAIDSNLLPPLESLVTNVGYVISDFSTWLDKSGTAKSAIADLGTAVGITAQAVGTLVGWAADLVGWFDQDAPQAYILVEAVTALGLAFAGLKLANTIAGFQQMFSKLSEGEGIVSNLASTFRTKVSTAIDDVASKQFPNLKKAMDNSRQSADDLAASEVKVGTVAKEDMAAGVQEGSTKAETSLSGVETQANAAATAEETVGTTAKTTMAADVETGSLASATSLDAIKVSADEAVVAEETVGTTAETKMAGGVEAGAASGSAAISGMGGGLIGLLAMLNLIGNQLTYDAVKGHDFFGELTSGDWQSALAFLATVATPGGTAALSGDLFTHLAQDMGLLSDSSQDAAKKVADMNKNVVASLTDMKNKGLEQTSQLTWQAQNMFANMGNQVGIDMSNMDATAKGYWNDVADYINNHPLNVPLHNQSSSQHYAEGTDYAPGGPSLVGEAGAELVLGPSFGNLPAGSKVIPHEQTMAMLGGGSNQDSRVIPNYLPGGIGGGGYRITVEIPIVVNGREFARATVDDIMEYAMRRTNLAHGRKVF